MIGTGIGLGLAGYRINPAGFGALPALDLWFSNFKTLSATTGPTPSFSRASSGTYFDGNGVLQTASTNVARFNHTYNGTSWVSKGLLIEGQRTNLILQSNTLTDAAWSKYRLSVSSDSTVGPDGSTISKIVSTSASAPQQIYNTTKITLSASTNYTLSLIVKKGDSNFISTVLVGDSGNYIACVYDISGTSDTTASQTAVGATSGTIVSSSAKYLGNGFFRVSMTGSTTFSGGYNFWVQFQNAATGNTFDGFGNTSTGGANGAYFYAGYAQLESGSFPTSYIPTTSSSVTRSADVCQITGSDFSGFWNQSEGSFTAECDVNGFNDSGVNYMGVASSGGLSQYAFVGRFQGSLTSLNYQIYNGSPAGDITLTLTAATLTKSAFGFKANDCAASVNGGTVSTDVSVAMTTALTQLEIGNFLGNNFLNGHISRLRYWNTRLENGTLRVLST